MSESHEKPLDQRPEAPDFWCKRFAQGTMPWDAGQVPENLKAFAQRQSRPLRTLIPGCGSAYEAGYLAALGWPVTALDFSPAAVAQAQAILGDWPGELCCADFFSWQPEQPLDLIYERAFLCALPRRMWADWAARMAELLPSGALLVGFFFFSDEPKGPPFGISESLLLALMSPGFERLVDLPVENSVPVFAGRERWLVWQRR